MEGAYERPEQVLDWNELRTKLHLSPEPALDPETVEIDQLHLSRLALVPIEGLSDEKLPALFHQATRWGLRRVRNRVARMLDQRPSLITMARIPVITLYAELALEAAQDADRAGADAWLTKGRQAESPQKRSANSVAWEMIGLQVKMILDPPEVWVPALAVILERYQGNEEATSAVLMRLVNLGLVQAAVDPKRPDQLILDTRILEAYMKEYGPRVTTATGKLGVAASQSEIWTPETAGSSAPIWTPGSPSAPAQVPKNQSSSCPASDRPRRARPRLMGPRAGSVAPTRRYDPTDILISCAQIADQTPRDGVK